MKRAEEVMEILEAFDAVGTLRGAAQLAGCDHKTVAHYVAERDRGAGEWTRTRRSRPRVDRFAEKIEELVERSRAKIRADKVHERLVAMGYEGSERTTRRAVAEAKRTWRRDHGRRTRSWIPEPGHPLLRGGERDPPSGLAGLERAQSPNASCRSPAGRRRARSSARRPGSRPPRSETRSTRSCAGLSATR